MNKYFILSLNLLFFIAISSAQTVSIDYFDFTEQVKKINQVYKTFDDQILLATAKGLFRLENDTIVAFDEKNKQISKLNKIIIDKNKNIWLGTYTSSIYRIDSLKQIRQFDLLDFTKQEKQLITSLNLDKEKLWFTTSEGIIGSIDFKSLKINKEDSPVENHIYGLMIDYNNQHWVSTVNGLFFKSSKSDDWRQIKDFTLAYGTFNNKQEYWTVGRDKKNQAVLMYLDNYKADFSKKKKQSWEKLKFANLPNLYARFNDLSFTSKNIIWIATDDGIIIYNPYTGLSHSIHSDKYPEFRIKNVTNIQVQTDSIIWAVSEGAAIIRIKYLDATGQ